MIKRLLQIQEKKVDLMLGTLQMIAHIFYTHKHELPNDIKKEYIGVTEKFIKEYRELVEREEEGYGEIQENEQN